MSLTRRELLEKSLAFGAATFLSGLRPTLQRDRLAGQANERCSVATNWEQTTDEHP
jgi:hypothetical protein